MIEAFHLAVKYMTPVVVLSDSYLANSAEPWLIPSVESLPRAPVVHRTDPEGYKPYSRDPETLARPWAIPGTPGLEHRLGGLSKQELSGNVSYDPKNHERMIQLRAEKVARMTADIPPIETFGPDRGDLLVVGWGGTLGSIHTAVEEAQREGRKVSSIHLRHLNPFPANLGKVLERFDNVLVPELNSGHLTSLLRDRFLVPAELMSKVQGQPFKVEEIRARIAETLRGGTD
jgi:2-oxoglutarate ferredoxin oxidoreductase subunit alpha